MIPDLKFIIFALRVRLSGVHAQLLPGFLGRPNTLAPLTFVTKVAVVTQHAFGTLIPEPE